MGLLFAGIVLLAATSLVAATPLGCEELVAPYTVESPQAVLGKWTYVLGAAEPEGYHQALGHLTSFWIDLASTGDNHTLTQRWAEKCSGWCRSGEFNATFAGVSATFQKNEFEHKGQLLQTCPGCLLWTDTFRDQNNNATGRYFMQFTRNGKVDPTDVEMFKKQLQCLNFAPSFHRYDGKTELCPDDHQQTE